VAWMGSGCVGKAGWVGMVICAEVGEGGSVGATGAQPFKSSAAAKGSESRAFFIGLLMVSGRRGKYRSHAPIVFGVQGTGFGCLLH